MAKIQIGDAAPDFTLPSQKGATVNLYQILKKSNVVLFFYPKDFTAVCTTEVCKFRDNYHAFIEAGAEVIGISSDSIETHKNFASKYALPFHIVSDKNNEIRKKYGVPSTLGLFFPGRVTYVIDKKGVVRSIFSSQFRVNAHIDDTLKVLRNLK